MVFSGFCFNILLETLLKTTTNFVGSHFSRQMPPKRSTRRHLQPPPSPRRNLASSAEHFHDSSNTDNLYNRRPVTSSSIEQMEAIVEPSTGGVPSGESDTLDACVPVDSLVAPMRMPRKVKLILPTRKTIERKSKTESIRNLKAREIGSRRNLRPIEESVGIEQDPLSAARALVVTARPLKAGDQPRDAQGENAVPYGGVLVEKHVGPYVEPVSRGRGRGRGRSGQRGKGRRRARLCVGSALERETGGMIELDDGNGQHCIQLSLSLRTLFLRLKQMLLMPPHPQTSSQT
ncbi:hypothetical protein BT69DRAFT_280328 [Atractiella rhizophila]|nr:hypothetical protein BT69DRAFT_280328 [Atractiella rhizophila]